MDDDEIDDRTAQFLIIVGDVCESARVARLPVTVQTYDGRSLTGVPGRAASMGGDSQVDETGMRRSIAVGDEDVELETVSTITVDVPSDAGAG